MAGADGRRAAMCARLLVAALWAGGGFAVTPVRAAEAAPAVADPALEARVQRLAAELRCLVCQNQTIADSNADLAVDLRRQVREMLLRGDGEAAIRAYMTDRYGDFILYRPPLKGTTAALWFGPALLLAGGAGALFVVLRRRERLGAAEFDAEVGADPGDTDIDADGDGSAPPGRRPPVAAA